MRLRPLDVVLRRPAVDDVGDPQTLEEVLEVVVARRRGEHDDKVAPLQLADERGRALEWLALVAQAGEFLGRRLAQAVAEPALDLLPGDRLDELVAAHADVAVPPPPPHQGAQTAERPGPPETAVGGSG